MFEILAKIHLSGKILTFCKIFEIFLKSKIFKDLIINIKLDSENYSIWLLEIFTEIFKLIEHKK